MTELLVGRQYEFVLKQFTFMDVLLERFSDVEPKKNGKFFQVSRV